MNKLGFYTKNFGAPGVFEAFRDVKPPVLLTELDDKGMLRRIRNELSPETFVVGRFFFTTGEQDAMLDADNPVQVGIELAERVITHDFNFAKQRGTNGRLFVDAWMTLNECIPGPDSSVFKTAPDKMKRRAAAYDAIQVAFLNRLRQEDPDLEAVAFNFAAGNWASGADLISFFPKTLEAYTYLGFHEYGWPHMNPESPGVASGCGNYRQALSPIRGRFGNRHKVIITEAGLARMYKHPGGGDVGWLFPGDPVSEESYKDSLRWYNRLLVEDDFVLGACLFQVGPGGKWVSFRHTGQDDQGRPLTLMQELITMAREPRIMVTDASISTRAAVPLRDGLYPPFIYGLHGPGGEHLMLEAGRAGWVLELAEVGHHPPDVPSADYTRLGEKGLGVIVRLNHAFGSAGSIPLPDLYPAFAETCAAFVAKAQGCRMWIIGNQPNHEAGRPEGQPILPDQYADCYRRCRAAIHNLAGHEQDQVLVAGPALWNANTTYPENPSGDWVRYFADILSHLGRDECDGFALSTYTHLHDPTRIRVDIPHPDPGHHHLRDEFRAYVDLMEAIPARFRRLPVTIAETGPIERHRGWEQGQNRGWVRAAYQEIADWNSHPAHQPILALILYRWIEAADQAEYSIADRPGIQDDFRDALRAEPADGFRLHLPGETRVRITARPGDAGPAAPDLQLVTNQMVITAFTRAGAQVDVNNPWVLMEKAGLRLGQLAGARRAMYQGPPLDQLPDLTEADRALIRAELAALIGPGGVEAAINLSVFTSPKAPIGFLRTRSELLDVPLAPPQAMQIEPGLARGSVEQGVVRTWNRYGWLLATLADVLHVESGVAVAVMDMLAGASGFAGDARLVIRFENHIFFDVWGREHAAEFQAHFRFDPVRPWQRHQWRPTPDGDWQTCHGVQGREWGVFEFAQGLDDTAARLSTVMGAPGILGLNYALIGHMSVDQMFEDFSSGEGHQITGLFDLIAGPSGASRALSALQARDFEDFVALHLGSGQVARYSSLLRRAYEAFDRLKPL